MTGPSWLAETLAVVMLATAVYCASRMVAAWRWRRPTEYDVDGVHMLMGVAMSGMLVPRLDPFPGRGWALAFGGAAAWFGGQAIRGLSRRYGRQRAAHHVQHLLASAAMLYMALAVSPARTGGPAPGLSMAGTSAGPARVPTLALVLATALLGYVIWTTDRLTSLGPAAVQAASAGAAGSPAPAAVAAAPPMSARLAACCEIAMGVTMGYMLITML